MLVIFYKIYNLKTKFIINLILFYLRFVTYLNLALNPKSNLHNSKILILYTSFQIFLLLKLPRICNIFKFSANSKISFNRVIFPLKYSTFFYQPNYPKLPTFLSHCYPIPVTITSIIRIIRHISSPFDLSSLFSSQLVLLFLEWRKRLNLFASLGGRNLTSGREWQLNFCSRISYVTRRRRKDNGIVILWETSGHGMSYLLARKQTNLKKFALCSQPASLTACPSH